MSRTSTWTALPIACFLGLAACDDAGTATTAAGGSSTASATTTTSSSSTTSTASTSASTGTGTSVMELVHMNGRFDEADPAGAAFTWSGTSLSTRIMGSELSVTLDGAGGVYFQIIVDGDVTGQLVTTGGKQTYPLVTGLSAGAHDVEVHRRNEGFYGAVNFVAFEPGAGTTLVESPDPYVHRLEFIGDSLTCGYGIEGATGCSFSAETESAYTTYAAVAARSLKAEAHLVAFSGKGVFQNYAGDKVELMPELWLRTLTGDPAPWDFTKYTPEAVIVNLGTNDFSAPVAQAEFEGAYVDLLQAVRQRYPAARIFAVRWASWGATHESWVTNALATFGDANTEGIEFTTDPADGQGCDGHTNVTSNAKLGAKLTAALKSSMGW